MDAEQALEIWIKLGLISEDKAAAARATIHDKVIGKSVHGASPAGFKEQANDFNDYNHAGSNGHVRAFDPEDNGKVHAATCQRVGTNIDAVNKTVGQPRAKPPEYLDEDSITDQGPARLPATHDTKAVPDHDEGIQTQPETNFSWADSLVHDSEGRQAGKSPGPECQHLPPESSRIAGDPVDLNDAVKAIETAGNNLNDFGVQVTQLANAIAGFQLDDLSLQIARLVREIEEIKLNLGRSGQ